MSEYEIWNEIGNIYLKGGEYEKAESAYKKVIAENPDFVEPFSKVASIFVSQGRLKEALPLFQRGIELSTKSVDRANIWNEMGDVYRILDDHAQASSCYRKAIVLDPKDAGFQEKLADVAQSALDPTDKESSPTLQESAREAGQNGAQGRMHQSDSPSSVGNPGVAEDSVSGEPHRVPVQSLVRLGIQNWQKGEPAKAAYFLKKAMDGSEEFQDILKESDIQTANIGPQMWNEEGDIYLEHGFYEDAISSYLRAIELDPENPTYKANLENAKRVSRKVEGKTENTFLNPNANEVSQPDGKEIGQPQETTASPEKSILRPDNRRNADSHAPQWISRNHIPHGLPKVTETYNLPAVEERELVAVDSLPETVSKQQFSSTSERGRTLKNAESERSLYAQITPELEQSLARDENDLVDIPKVMDEKTAASVISAERNSLDTEERNIRDPLPHPISRDSSINMPSMERQTLENDITAYRRIVEMNSANDRAWDTLGNLYESVGLHDEAVEAFRHAVESNPMRENYHYHLGMALVYQMQYEKAIQAFYKVIEMNPNHMLAHSALAGSYRRFGREAEAQEHIKIARPTMEIENEYNRACFESICGNTDRAIALLEIALRKQQTQPVTIRSDPDFDFVRRDPRFEALLQRNRNVT